MTLRSEVFYISKGGLGLESVNRYIFDNIEYDAYLIKGISASVLNDSVTLITLTYSKYDEEMIQDISPRQNYILTTGIPSGNFGIKVLFSQQISTTLQSGSVLIDGSGLPVSAFSLDGYSNSYTLDINSSQFTITGSHYYLLDNSKLYRQDGSAFASPGIGGYSFHSQSSAYLGDRYGSSKDKIRGKISADVIYLSKSTNIQNYIDQYLKSKNVHINHLITYSNVSRVVDQVELYLVYISDPEPQIITGYPQNHSLIPSNKAPKNLTLTFSTELDKYQLVSQPSLIAITSGFGTTTEVNPSHITLLNDNKTISIDMQSYLTSSRVYTVVVRPGIISNKRFIKQKPDFWTIVLDTYEGSAGNGDANMNDVMRRISFRGMGA
jgi:hypothetical protein